jgi:hypothetical protein
MEIDVTLPVDDAPTLLRTAATGHVASRGDTGQPRH